MKEAVRDRVRLKKQVKEALQRRDLEGVARLALENPTTIGILFNLSYDKQSLITWRAVEAMGEVGKALTERSKEEGRELMKRLLWSITEESGGLGWSSIEMMAEVVLRRPDVFSDIPLLLPEYFEEPVFRESVIYALWRIASERPDLLELEALKEILKEALQMDEPYLWALALMTIDATRNLIDYDDLDIKSTITADQTPLRIYRDGDFIKTTVKEIWEKLALPLKTR
ncbi:MAG: hypothetical protein D6710_03665 [Nitrospirae bacterium]|nr:MAG: hypothetical protein D6710_03665 [Nitrospirota bacterium]